MTIMIYANMYRLLLRAMLLVYCVSMSFNLTFEQLLKDRESQCTFVNTITLKIGFYFFILFIKLCLLYLYSKIKYFIF